MINVLKEKAVYFWSENSNSSEHGISKHDFKKQIFVQLPTEDDQKMTDRESNKQSIGALDWNSFWIIKIKDSIDLMLFKFMI